MQISWFQLKLSAKAAFACDLIIKHKWTFYDCNYILIIVIFFSALQPKSRFFLARMLLRKKTQKSSQKHKQKRRCVHVGSHQRARASGWFKVCVECCLSFIPSVSFQTQIIAFSSGLSLSAADSSASAAEFSWYPSTVVWSCWCLRRRAISSGKFHEKSAINKRKVIEVVNC